MVVFSALDTLGVSLQANACDRGRKVHPLIVGKFVTYFVTYFGNKSYHGPGDGGTPTVRGPGLSLILLVVTDERVFHFTSHVWSQGC